MRSFWDIWVIVQVFAEMPMCKISYSKVRKLIIPEQMVCAFNEKEKNIFKKITVWRSFSLSSTTMEIILTEVFSKSFIISKLYPAKKSIFVFLGQFLYLSHSHHSQWSSGPFIVKNSTNFPQKNNCLVLFIINLNP